MTFLNNTIGYGRRSSMMLPGRLNSQAQSQGGVNSTIIGSSQPAPLLPGQGQLPPLASQGPDTYTPSATPSADPSRGNTSVDVSNNSLDPSQSDYSQNTNSNSTNFFFDNAVIQKIGDWINNLPVWAKTLAGLTALGVTIWAGKSITQNAGSWAQQISRSFVTKPFGSKEVREARFNLHDRRHETRSLKNKHETLLEAQEDQQDLLSRAKAAYKGFIQRQGLLKGLVARTGVGEVGKETSRLRAELKAAKTLANETKAGLETVGHELRISADQQMQAHVALTQQATLTMVAKREHMVERLEQDLLKAQNARDKVKDKNLDGMQMRVEDLRRKLQAAKTRSEEAKLIAQNAKSLRNPNEIFVTPTGLVTFRTKGGTMRQVLSGGLTVPDSGYSTGNPLINDCVSYQRDVDGRTLRGTGTVALLPVKWTATGAVASGLRASGHGEVIRPLIDNNNGSNTGGFWTDPKDWLWGFLNGSSRTTPMVPVTR